MNNHKSSKHSYILQDFLPLISIFGFIVLFTVSKQWWYGWHMYTAMSDFMGAFFVIFGLFKIVNLHGFVEAYRMYDIVAQRSKVYAYIYPFIELMLGIAYLTRFQLFSTNVITFILMFVSSIGVGLELAKGKKIVCACLGAVFKIPMTYVTLAEDVVMGIMALIMLYMA
ncbi:MAG TPA: hypothetical protein PLU71_00835 [Candidatus Dependentiae bacterium]|nr:hypothetical protein [Candidatus Dependentiae bacterium]HRQ62379.1 hypothetical protein [Candidatus Dependentiae bacterium]